MRMYDLIVKKRDGGTLTEAELRYMITGYIDGSIPDYQMSAMLMAIYFNGMSKEETAILTLAMAHSGDVVDLSGITGIKVDKHSTGGVGDKTTLIIGPIAAACGVKVAKMSGRGLGHTGGTVDKMEAVPGLRTSFTREEFFDIVNRVGICVAGQSGNLAPGDKKLYALRDVTGTVESIPLIAASVMSKKIAAGSDSILLDVKTGSGAFMKTIDDSLALAAEMVEIGERAGRRMAALITDMDVPLGRNIGNALEVIEAIETLQGQGPSDLTEVCLNLAGNMLYLAEKGSIQECIEMARRTIADGSALAKLAEMIAAQGGDREVVAHPERLEWAPLHVVVKARQSGWITHMDTEKCGIASALLGAGRETKDSEIDYGAGIILQKKTGDQVAAGDILAEFYTSDQALISGAEEIFRAAIEIGAAEPARRPLILARVEKEHITRYTD